MDAASVPIVPALRLAPSEASRRWAALLQQSFEVDPLACPRCRGTMRIVVCITRASVIDQILTHLRTRAARGVRPGARSPPSTRAPAGPGTTRRPTATAALPHAPGARPRYPGDGPGPFGVRGDPESAAHRTELASR